MAWVCDRIARVGRRVSPPPLIARIGVVVAAAMPDPLVPSIDLGAVVDIAAEPFAW